MSVAASPPGSDLTVSQLIEALKWKVFQEFRSNIGEGLSAAQCDETERSLNTVTCTIRSIRNTFAPIHILPAEIIAEVLFHAIADTWTQSCAWVKYTHVSRYWRDCALRFPQLWTRIRVKDECPLMELLPRSKAANIVLDLQFSDTIMEDARLKTFMELFQANFKRIKVLRWILSDNVNFNNRLWLQLDKSEPTKLDKLAISVPSHHARNLHQTLPPIFRNSLPNLTMVDISGVSKWAPDTPFRNLSSITLRHQYDLIRPVSRFLDFLEHSRQLQHLSLYLSGPNTEDCRNRSLRLDRLKSINLFVENCSDAVTILSHLIIPQVSRVIIDIQGSRNDVWFLPLPQNLSPLGDLEKISTVLLMRRYDRNHIFADGGKTSLSMSRGDTRTPRSALRLFLSPHSVASLRRLCIAGYWGCNLARHSWLLACFGDLTLLQSLTLTNPRDVPSILGLLIDSHDPEGVTCPALREIQVVYDAEIDAALVKFVHDRKAMGYPVQCLRLVHRNRWAFEIDALRNSLDIKEFTSVAFSPTVQDAEKKLEAIVQWPTVPEFPMY